MTKISDFWWKNTDVSRTEGVCHMIYIFFGSFLEKILKSAKFHPCGICMIGFREGKLGSFEKESNLHHLLSFSHKFSKDFKS